MKQNDSPWEIEFYSPGGGAIDGTPIGNGQIGAMLEAHQLDFRLHLAKDNIWHNSATGLTPPGSFFPAKDFNTIKKLVQTKKFEKINALFRKACAKDQSKYMLMPAALLQIFPEEAEIELAAWSRKLDMKRAAARLDYKTRQRQAANCFIASNDYDVIAAKMRCRSRQLPYCVKIVLQAKTKAKGARIRYITDKASQAVYMHYRFARSPLEEYVVGVRVEGPAVRMSADNGQASLAVRSKNSQNTTSIYTAIVSSRDCDDPLEETARRLTVAAEAGFDTIWKKHRSHWNAFWKCGRVCLPDSLVQRQHNLGMYLLGSCSRPGSQAPGLQGLWSFNEAGSGWNDYTNDFNSQAYFWPAYTGNQLQLAEPYYETFKGMLPQVNRDTKKYYKARGAAYPLSCSPEGYASPGYVTHTHTAGTSAFIAQNYYWGYLYTLDKSYLRETAYPVMRECAAFYLDRIDIERGKAVIHATTSPEEGEGGYEAWGDNATMDIALIRQLLAATIDAATVLNCDDALCGQWQDLLERLPDYPVKNGYLIEMQGREFKDSYRHAAVVTPTWPCDEMTSISRAADRRLGEASFQRYLDKGQWGWAGYTYPWVAILAARLGQGNRAEKFLREFFGVGCLQCGGLHMNADFGGTLKTATGEKNFTLEGNTMYSTAVFEMLLQSHNNAIHIFPALPDAWQDVSFEDLRARGAFLVSAQRRGGQIKEFTIKSLAGTSCCMLNPFGSGDVVVRQRRSGKSVNVDTRVKGKRVSFETSKNSLYVISCRKRSG